MGKVALYKLQFDCFPFMIELNTINFATVCYDGNKSNKSCQISRHHGFLQFHIFLRMVGLKITYSIVDVILLPTVPCSSIEQYRFHLLLNIVYVFHTPIGCVPQFANFMCSNCNNSLYRNLVRGSCLNVGFYIPSKVNEHSANRNIVFRFFFPLAQVIKPYQCFVVMY